MNGANVSRYALWALKIIAGLAFLAAGAAKLAGAQQMVAVFDGVGVGQWFRYATGLIEIAGAALLFVPGKAIYGAGLLGCTMIGAIFTHLFLIGGSPVPAVVLLLICAAIAWMHRDQATAPVRA